MAARTSSIFLYTDQDPLSLAVEHLLDELDKAIIGSATNCNCIGGLVVSLLYGLPATCDVDYIASVRVTKITRIEELDTARRMRIKLAEKDKVHLQQ